MAGSVCVIVPSVGNHIELGVTLDGLLSQTYAEVEVVVVGPDRDEGRVVSESKGAVSYTHLTLPTTLTV